MQIDSDIFSSRRDQENNPSPELNVSYFSQYPDTDQDKDQPAHFLPSCGTLNSPELEFQVLLNSRLLHV